MQYTPPRRRVMIGGAQPPEELTWQTGKTVASIDFVNEATQYLEEYKKELQPHQVKALMDAIDKIKSGELSFSATKTPDEYLKEVE